ncbi:MAG TPA: hypothetical protein PKJ33_03305 [Alphaproteobacteria bacterium]|nr:hypothetical protein [Alphaproteobacteria bacterium]
MRKEKQFYVPHVSFYLNAYVTYFCNRACEHCLTCSSPKRSKEILPFEDILFYIHEFKKSNNFRHVVLNGGEATSAYYFHSDDYMSILYTELLKNKCNIELHTNSVWASSAKADIIWQDLKILDNPDKCGSSENILDLSCDKYHKNMKEIKESIKILSGSEFNQKKLSKKILSFKNDPIVAEVQNYQKKDYPKSDIFYSIYNDVIKTGRAAKNNIGIDVPFFEYQTEYTTFINFWSDFMISLYPNRTASIGASHDGKRRVSYVNKDGSLKSWEQLYPQLVQKYLDCYKADKCNLLDIKVLTRAFVPKNCR